jgi:hypothetical protein
MTIIPFIFGMKACQHGVKAIIHRKGILEEMESISWNVVKNRFLLLLDRLTALMFLLPWILILKM